jgi:hypothetical protein
MRLGTRTVVRRICCRDWRRITVRDVRYVVDAGSVSVGGSDGFFGVGGRRCSQWWAGTLAVEGEAKARATAGLAFVVAHPPKTGEDGAPAWAVGMGRQKLGCATRQKTEAKLAGFLGLPHLRIEMWEWCPQLRIIQSRATSLFRGLSNPQHRSEPYVAPGMIYPLCGANSLLPSLK